MNCIVFTLFIVQRRNASLVKKQTGQGQWKLITRLYDTRDYKLLYIFTWFDYNFRKPHVTFDRLAVLRP